MTEPTTAKKPSHRATYSRDNKQGGWNVRVVGPQANMFAGREVPVTMKDGSTHMEKLDKLLWTGTDKDTGQPVAVYSFVAKPKEDQDEIPF